MLKKGVKPPLVPCLFRFVIAILLGCLAVVARAQETAVQPVLADKQILILTSYGDGRPGVDVLLQGFRSTLTRGGLSVDRIFTEHLDLQRVGDPLFRHSLAETLNLKYGKRHFDFVYAVEQPALDFALKELAGTLQGVPIMMARAILPEDQMTGHTFIRQLLTYDLAGTVQRARELFPRTRRVMFVVGSTPSDRAVLAQALLTHSIWPDGVVYEDTSGQTLDQVTARISNPGPGSVIVVLPFNSDSAGHTAVQMEVAIMVAAKAGAPVFTLWDNPVGQGAVGGNVTNFIDVGRQGAELALEILRGRSIRTGPVTDLPGRSFPKFDWKQIERWHGEPANLPKDSEFINRPITRWSQYRRTVLLTLGSLLAQTLLIALLLVQRRLRTQAQGQLRESELRFRRAVTEAPVPIMIHAEDGEVLALSRAWTELSGYSATDLPTIESWLNKAYRDNKQAVGQIVAGHYEMGVRRTVGELGVTCRDGSIRTWDFSAISLGNLVDGRRLAMTIAPDVTGRRATELELREALKFNEEIIRSAQEGIIVLGPDLRPLIWNPFMESLTGIPADEVLGQDPRDIFPFLDLAGVLDAQERALQGECVESVTFHFHIERTGKSGWVSNTSSTLRSSRGEIIGVIGMVRDVTAEHLAEEQKAISQAQLHQNQKMESLGNLAGGIAHDMNNVLGAILSLASAHLSIQPEGSQVHQAFATISEAATRGGKMVKSLLTFARQHPAENRQLDLNTLLRQDLTLLQHTTLAKVRLETVFANDLRPVMGDGSALANAFLNVCINAVDAMPGGGVLTLRTRNASGGQVEVEIQDTGHGMPPEVLAKAMNPFFTTKEVGKGTGLGLPTVFTTVKAHKGDMDIRSVVDQGTLVTMRFPACDFEGLLPQTKTEPSGMEARKGLKVLVIDDDELIQKSTRMLLEVLGHIVTPAFSGEDALATLGGGLGPDAVILDMNMPGLGGKGTLPLLRGLCPTVPVLLATGRADQEALDLVAAHPFVTLMSKPFGFEELRECLQKVVGLGSNEHGA